ncbi:UNVERIFIED_CONTAM: Transposon Tf2-11 polyprotein [Sesamum radiatum]|uniref:Transposon Tf2-11 polyprotein n=1 Tax=Sesamum radiatum TaxID=300843 RepID=A0AAW2IN68_SESRA
MLAGNLCNQRVLLICVVWADHSEISLGTGDTPSPEHHLDQDWHPLGSLSQPAGEQDLISKVHCGRQMCSHGPCRENGNIGQFLSYSKTGSPYCRTSFVSDNSAIEYKGLTHTASCLMFVQQDKADASAKKGRLFGLQPLPIPTRPWESVSMDYISGLPKAGDLGSIIVVVDRLSKYATFIAAPKHVTAEGTAHLFFKHIVKYWGLPKDIVSDRDSRFTGVFWTELFKILGSKLSMSSSYHPQSDGQTERFNSMLEEYLRHFVRGTQKDWVKLLDVAQLCFNAQKSSPPQQERF